jgi:hypothetical protein
MIAPSPAHLSTPWLPPFTQANPAHISLHSVSNWDDIRGCQALGFHLHAGVAINAHNR